VFDAIKMLNKSLDIAQKEKVWKGVPFLLNKTAFSARKFKMQ